METTSLIERILLSKKLIYAAIPVVANMVAGLFGIDPSHQAILILDAFFALLLIFQGFLDLRYGSESDGTKQGVLPAPAPQTVVQQVVADKVPEIVAFKPVGMVGDEAMVAARAKAKLAAEAKA